jgi:hypothetical protein
VLPLYRRPKEDPEKVTDGAALDSSHREEKRKRRRQLKS